MNIGDGYGLSLHLSFTDRNLLIFLFVYIYFFCCDFQVVYAVAVVVFSCAHYCSRVIFISI